MERKGSGTEVGLLVDQRVGRLTGGDMGVKDIVDSVCASTMLL